MSIWKKYLSEKYVKKVNINFRSSNNYKQKNIVKILHMCRNYLIKFKVEIYYLEK